MNSKDIRQRFKDFFASKGHQIIDSAPMVIKDDPSLMFTNAGMNQFKDVFLGYKKESNSRIANSQKCLRVSGKHNDLDEVGHDTYHHTMFEMLGNWSFGDYFKKEAIEWAWEFLVDELGLSKDRLYATVFEGDSEDKIELDEEAKMLWERFLPKDRILLGNKKDNFWEMGNTGPCGSCSEIHIDLRDDNERKSKDGRELVNKDHPQVIEIWNLVFVQYNRKADGKLESLNKKYIDTGMGFERLCMAMQGKQSNYDTDIFQPLINHVSIIANVTYGKQKDKDIAMRVISDHIRTVAFSITDGQLPSNNKAGYVIRRILRRAVRYGFTFLDIKKPFMYQLIPVLVDVMGDAYPELKKQQSTIEKVVKEEEASFLRTLATGIKLLEQIIEQTKNEEYKVVSGKVAFELYDTYGFPLDLTQLILKENDLIVNKREFDEEMKVQKDRSRSASIIETDDWIILKDDSIQEFIGYDYTEANVHIVKYRKQIINKSELYQLVFNITPFYAEGGGQVGDVGYIEADGTKYSIIDVKREHNQTVHIVKEMPKDIGLSFNAVVNVEKRTAIENNHSATHLLHCALRDILGNHVEQKGSLVNPEYLRFDFSHFQKLTDKEIEDIEKKVNAKIRENVDSEEFRDIPIEEARKMGAMALFGEKYGDVVRVIRFGKSVELCGGTHVKATGQIGFFKIISESSVASGVRRIEALTAFEAEKYINTHFHLLKNITSLLKSNKNIFNDIENLIDERNVLTKQVEKFAKETLKIVKSSLKESIREEDGVNIIIEKVDVVSMNSLKDIAYQLKGEIDNLFMALGVEIDGKANLVVMISDNIVKERKLNAGNIIKEISKEIRGGGGGQPFFATAGGKNPEGIQNALDKAKDFIK
jgi:alanyl-tRNA synthetase